MIQPQIQFSTVIKKAMPEIVESIKEIKLNFLYSVPIIPVGATFEIIDDVNPEDTYLMVTIRHADSIFFVDSSNVPVGFLNKEEFYCNEEVNEDYSSVIAISKKFWIEKIISETDSEAMFGIEVMNIEQSFKNKLFRINYDDFDFTPIDIPKWVNKIADEHCNTLRKCVKLLLRERCELHDQEEVVLVTNTNLVVTKRIDKYYLYWLTNSIAEVYNILNSLESAKEYINQLHEKLFEQELLSK